jgi:hypothetical protein
MDCSGFNPSAMSLLPKSIKSSGGPYCGKRNKIKWPMGAELKILKETSAKAVSKARPSRSATLRSARFDSQPRD